MVASVLFVLASVLAWQWWLKHCAADAILEERVHTLTESIEKLSRKRSQSNELARTLSQTNEATYRRLALIPSDRTPGGSQHFAAPEFSYSPDMPQPVVGPDDDVKSSQLAVYLKKWAAVVNGRERNITCRNSSVPRPARLRRTGYGTRDADSWHVCYDDWQPWKTGCVGVSIGIGGEWGFEDGLAQQVGCKVYAFDPTEGLRVPHERHVKLNHLRNLIQFEAIGLGGEQKQARTTSIRYGKFDLVTSKILTLKKLLAKASRPIIDVLKIDCEGCEWTAFDEVRRNHPMLLSRVRIIMLEVHSIGKYGLYKSLQVHRLMNFLIETHGFHVYRSGYNKGWPGARHKIAPNLVRAGFPKRPCCWLLQMMRPTWNDSWKVHASQLG
jgi:FkbM family methyltransferase